MAYRLSRRDSIDHPAYYVTEPSTVGRPVRYAVMPPTFPDIEVLPYFENIRQRKPRKVYVYTQNDQTMFNILYADGSTEDVYVGDIIKGNHLDIEKIRDLMAWREEGSYRVRRRPRARSLSPPRSIASDGSYVMVPPRYRRRSVSPPGFRYSTMAPPTIFTTGEFYPEFSYVPTPSGKFVISPDGRPGVQYVQGMPSNFYYDDYYHGLTDDIYKWNQWRSSLDKVPMTTWQYPRMYTIPRPQVKVATSPMGYYDGYMIKDMNLKDIGDKVWYTTTSGGVVVPMQYYRTMESQRY